MSEENAKNILNKMIAEAKYNPTIPEKIEILEYLTDLYKNETLNVNKITTTISTLTGWQGPNSEHFFGVEKKPEEVKKEFIQEKLRELHLEDITKSTISPENIVEYKKYSEAVEAAYKKMKQNEHLSLADKILILANIKSNFRNSKTIIDGKILSRSEITDLLQKSIKNYRENETHEKVKLSDDILNGINDMISYQSNKQYFDETTTFDRFGMFILGLGCIGGGVALGMWLGGFLGVSPGLALAYQVILWASAGVAVTGGALVAEKAVRNPYYSDETRNLDSLVNSNKVGAGREFTSQDISKDKGHYNSIISSKNDRTRPFVISKNGNGSEKGMGHSAKRS